LTRLKEATLQNGQNALVLDLEGDEKRLRPIYEQITWHTGCEGRHGTIEFDTNGYSRQDVYDMLDFYFAAHHGKGAWSYGNIVEFTHMAKTFPVPTKPWGWCGSTVLFEDWRKREIGQVISRSEFSVGDFVEFTASKTKQTVRGFVFKTSNARRINVLVPGSDRYWLVPPKMLKKLPTPQL